MVQKLRIRKNIILAVVIGVIACVGITFASIFQVFKDSSVQVYPVDFTADIDLKSNLSDVVMGETVITKASFTPQNSTKSMFVRASVQYFNDGNLTDSDKRFLLAVNYGDIETNATSEYKWVRATDGYYYLTDTSGNPLKITSSGTTYTLCEDVKYKGAISIMNDVPTPEGLGLHVDFQAVNAKNLVNPTIQDLTPKFLEYFGNTPRMGYIVAFDTLGNGNIPAQTFFSDGATVSMPRTPYKLGSAFVGWYTDNTFTTAYDFTKPVTSDFTLYAKFVETKTVTIIADENVASVIITRQDGSIVDNGDSVPLGEKLTITATAKGECTVDGIKVNSTTISNGGTYTVVDNVVITVQLTLPAGTLSQNYISILEVDKTAINSITFYDNLDSLPSGVTSNTGYNLTGSQNTEKVFGYKVQNSTNSSVYDLHIASAKTIKLPQDCNFLFSLAQYDTSISGFKTSLTTINNLDLVDTSDVTNMTNMFVGCIKLASLDLSNFNTSKVVNMQGMFANCKFTSGGYDSSSILRFGSNFNTSKVENFGSMFSGCNKFENLDLTGFDTSSATDMSSMFYSCDALITLDLSSFNTSKVTDMSGMFGSCSNVANIYVGDGWSTDATTSDSSYYMFDGCTNLPNFDSSVVDKTNAHTGAGGYLTMFPYTFGYYDAITNPSSQFNGFYYIDMGYYPQTLYTGSATMTQVSGETYTIENDSGEMAECPVYTDGADKYVQFTMTTSNNSYYSNSNLAQYRGTKYYKIEPVRWLILGYGDNTGFASGDIVSVSKYKLTFSDSVQATVNNKGLLVLSEKVLVQQYFNSFATHTTSLGTTAYNDWEQSEIRAFMNGKFINDLFRYGEDNNIIAQNLTTTYRDTTSTQPGTIDTVGDRVFLLSCTQNNATYGVNDSCILQQTLKIGEVTNNMDYNNSTQSILQARASDLGYATGCAKSTGTGYEGNTSWWLRAGGYNSPSGGCYVGSFGKIGLGSVGYDSNAFSTNLGLRAAFVLDISGTAKVSVTKEYRKMSSVSDLVGSERCLYTITISSGRDVSNGGELVKGETITINMTASGGYWDCDFISVNGVEVASSVKNGHYCGSLTYTMTITDPVEIKLVFYETEGIWK